MRVSLTKDSAWGHRFPGHDALSQDARRGRSDRSRGVMLRRKRDLVSYRFSMVPELKLRVVNAVEFPDHAGRSSSGRGRAGARLAVPKPAERTALKPRCLVLRTRCVVDEFASRTHRAATLSEAQRALNVEQPVIAGGKLARLGVPNLRTGVGRVDGDVRDLGDLKAPIADHLEAFLVPTKDRQ